MCSTIAIGTGSSAGSRGITIFSACGPPVEMPMHDDVDRAGCRGRRATAGAGDLARDAPAARAAAALTFSISSSAISSSRSVASAVGFCTKSTAPASSAASTCSPDSLATLTMTIGTGRRAICC